MRRKDKEISDRAAIDDILNKSLVIRVAMTDENGYPYMIPMNFGYDGTTVFMHAAHEGRKVRILKKNPRVCLEVEADLEVVQHESRPCSWGMKFRSVLALGDVTFISEREQKSRALNEIMKKYSGKNGFTYDDTALDAVCVMAVKIESITGKKAGW